VQERESYASGDFLLKRMTQMSRESWLDYLLRNKAIRTFLAKYAEPDWQEVSKLLLLYGIAHLNQAGKQAALGVGELRELVRGAYLHNDVGDRGGLDSFEQDAHGLGQVGQTLTVNGVPVPYIRVPFH
jgi:hypothetical protein